MKNQQLTALGQQNFCELTEEELISVRGGDKILYWIGYYLGKLVRAGAEENSIGMTAYDVAL